MAIRSFSPGRLSFLNSFAESANYNCAEKHTKLFVCDLFLVTFPGLHCPKCHGCFLIYSFHGLKPRNFDILHNGTAPSSRFRNLKNKSNVRHKHMSSAYSRRSTISVSPEIYYLYWVITIPKEDFSPENSKMNVNRQG